MNGTPMNERNRTKIFRILMCIIALLALICAFTYMVRSIIISENNTKKFLAEAFLAFAPGQSMTTDATKDSQDKPTGTDEDPDVTDSSSAGKTEKVEIVSADLSETEATIKNYTLSDADVSRLPGYEFPFSCDPVAPTVLIIHSHPDECYSPDGATQADRNFPFTSEEKDENIFAVGKKISEVLSAAGIITIHAQERIDENTVGSSAQDVIDKYLAKYPTIRFVLDVHRDGVYTQDNRIVRSVGYIEGKAGAQLMFAVGSNPGGGINYTNLAAAYKLTDMICNINPGIMRSILLRQETLSQQYAPCSLSLYVGTTGNSLSEAVRSAELFAKYFAMFIIGNM